MKTLFVILLSIAFLAPVGASAALSVTANGYAANHVAALNASCGIATVPAQVSCVVTQIDPPLSTCVGASSDPAKVAGCVREGIAAHPTALSCLSAATTEQKNCILAASGATPNTPNGGNDDANAEDTRSGFYPLTQIPGISDVANASTLPNFLNTLYKLCVGLAAALAVLQIMRGGMTYMLGDSVTEKKEARNLIAMSVVGLLLVLSPAIVFGIIDPRILSLNVDFTKLQSDVHQNGDGNGDGGEGNGNGEEEEEENENTKTYAVNPGSYVLAFGGRYTDGGADMQCTTVSLRTYPSRAQCETAMQAEQEIETALREETPNVYHPWYHSCTVAQQNEITITDTVRICN